MSDEWIYPWPKPISMYDSDGPREKPLSYEPLDFELFGAKLRITATREEGIDSGRIRYRVECLTCDKVLHENTTGPSSRFGGHLEEQHGKPRRTFTKAERKRHGLVPGDGWDLLLECVKPGSTYLVLEMGGKVEGRVPIENILQAHIKIDEGAEAETQRQIKQWRDRAGDWESKYYDKKVDQMRLGQLEGEIEATKKSWAAAESKLADLRQAAHAPSDPLVAANLTTLLSGAMAMLARCPRCNGNARVDGMPCPYCGVFRELVQGIRPRDPHREAADLERGLAQLEGNRQEAAAERHRAHVFLLHPGVGTPPYWELGNERDPEVIRLRSGGCYRGVKKEAYGALPVAFMRGLFLALEPALSGGDVWTEATEFVEVDRERGLAACPERLRERYRGLAEGRW